ncbi:MAG: hypothetical protein ABS87_12285 [Sphingomonas sp. SCN 67-18]|nr:MAG: hypothetical protein ABS87_12285 [Sphingomonas sp. SCN 67-18]
MALLGPVSPLGALRDLRRFLASRERHELVFAFLAVLVTCTLIVGFILDNNMKKPYKRDIVYFENWTENRTDAEIVAQQKIDQARREVEEAKLEAARAKRRAEFKRLDDKLNKLGI